VFSLWAESDKKYGGLSLSSEDVGQVLAISGKFFSLLLASLTCRNALLSKVHVLYIIVPTHLLTCIRKKRKLNHSLTLNIIFKFCHQSSSIIVVPKTSCTTFLLFVVPAFTVVYIFHFRCQSSCISTLSIS